MSGNDALKQTLVENFRKVFGDARKLLTKDRLGYQHIGELNGVGLLAYDAIASLSLTPDERALLERTLQEIHDKLQVDAYITFFASFYKLPKTVYEGDMENVQQLLGKINLDVTATRVRIRAAKLAPFSMNDSIDGTFFGRLEGQFLKGVSNLLKYLPDAIPIVVYSLLNVQQTLAEYIDAGFPEFKSDAFRILPEVQDLVEKALASPAGQKVFKESTQLRMFVAAQVKESNRILGQGKPIMAPSADELQSLGIRQRLYGYLSLEGLDPRAFADNFGAEPPGKLAATPTHLVPLLLGLIVRKLRHDGDTSLGQELGLSVDWPSNDWFRLQDYLKGYDEISQAGVTSEDIKLVAELDDAQIRKILAQLVKNVDKVVVEREAVKPHGPAEIGDMDLPFRRNGEQYFLSFVIKSGKEVKGLLGEMFMGQVLRPFIKFGERCIVVLVTARRCSQNLLNSLKEAQSRFNQRIFVIQEAELAALLEVNEEL